MYAHTTNSLSILFHRRIFGSTRVSGSGAGPRISLEGNFGPRDPVPSSRKCAAARTQIRGIVSVPPLPPFFPEAAFPGPYCRRCHDKSGVVPEAGIRFRGVSLPFGASLPKLRWHSRRGVTPPMRLRCIDPAATP